MNFAEICKFVVQCHEKAAPEEFLEGYFRKLSQNGCCNDWKIHNSSSAEFLSTWRRVKQPDTVPEPPPEQKENGKENCWALAFEVGQTALLKIKRSHRAPIHALDLVKEVPAHHQSDTCAVDRLEDVKSSIVGNYVRDMVVHHRPRGNDEASQNKFESLIEKLLVKSPVVVAFDVFPSYAEDFSGQGIYSPTPTDLHMLAYQRFPRHCVVLYGKGVQVTGSEIQEFWEALETRGKDFGDKGFVRFARRQLLIREVVELKV